MESIFEYVIGALIVFIALALLLGLRGAIRKFAPKSIVREAAINLIDNLYRTIDEELEKVLKDKSYESSDDIALSVFLNVKNIYKDKLDDIVDAFSIHIELPSKTAEFVSDVIDKGLGDKYAKVDRLIFHLIETKVENRHI